MAFHSGFAPEDEICWGCCSINGKGERAEYKSYKGINLLSVI